MDWQQALMHADDEDESTPDVRNTKRARLITPQLWFRASTHGQAAPRPTLYNESPIALGCLNSNSSLTLSRGMERSAAGGLGTQHVEDDAGNEEDGDDAGSLLQFVEDSHTRVKTMTCLVINTLLLHRAVACGTRERCFPPVSRSGTTQQTVMPH